MSTAAPQNLLLAEVEYQVETTAWGTWRRFVYPSGARFAEFTSHRAVAGLPLVHYTYGKCPETGKRIIAHGVVAVGRLAHGIIAVGQASLGVIAIGQLAIGLGLGIGQAATGVFSFGQLAIGMVFALGQLAVGQVAIGQVAVGGHVLAQLGWGKHVADVRAVDPAAKDFFWGLIGK
jgi:hypothetical protein